MHLSMLSRRGIGQDFDILQKIAVKFPTPGQKCEVKYNQISHPEKWSVVTGTKKFRYPYPRNSKKIQMPYPRAKKIDQNPALCPFPPPPPPAWHW